VEAVEAREAGWVEAPERWGLGTTTVGVVAERVRAVWERYRTCFRTQTRDTSENAWIYLRGLLTMDQERTFANIARRVQDPAADGQRVQHFMSASPWSAQAVLEQVRAEVAHQPEIRSGNVLILDESADGKAGEQTAGVGRQYNGRLGKVELSQVGTFLALANEARRFWTWIDGELFLPERWCAPQRATLRQRLGIPPERQFATKIELGWQMIQRVRVSGVPFEAVLCDELYGRSRWLRAQLDAASLLYVAEVPADTPVYVTPPAFGVPTKAPEAKGRAFTQPRVLAQSQPIPASQVTTLPETHFTVVPVREAERGLLADTFAARSIWTVRQGLLAREWLVIRRHQGRQGRGTPVKQKISYALSNAPADTPLARLAELKCLRYGIECANREAKSDLGWDDFRAQKYRAWEHHLALTILAAWFVAQTKLEWAQQTPPDPALAADLGVVRVPALSVANVRELLKASLPLPQLTPEQAQRLVIKHLVGRSRATASRRKRRHPTKDTT
jgi:SRSO17 transposase